MISINNISIHFTGVDLFSNVSFLINKRDRIGLIGKNGSGKTTLLNIICCELKPQQGEVIVPANTSIGYLPQEKVHISRKTIFDEALMAFSEHLKLENRIHKLSKEISHRTDYDSNEYINLIHNLTESNERFQVIGGQTITADTERVLTGLGFKREDFGKSVNKFSSGWQMRVELAKILLQKPEVILLDEPTNHLDIESIQWLEDFLVNYFGSVVIVSHDRAFLDNVTNRTIEISKEKIYIFKANYSAYVKMREERLEQQQATFNNQQKQVRQIERFIERFRYKNTKSRQVQSKIKMLDKLENIEIDETDKSTIYFRFPPAPRSGKVVVESHKLGKKYGDLTVLKNLDFSIIKGDSVAFAGKNGEGKTTLARIIINELDHSGELKFGHNTQIGYFAQNQGDYLDLNKTVFETIDDIAAGEIRKQVRNILGAFLFGGDTIDKKVKVLSGGEKSRLSLAKLLLTPSNLLVLDEPTNHLDMQSKDILKNALLQYDGTLIIVSHDRDFLQGLTNKVFEFKNQGIKEYLGDIYDFLENRKLKSLQQLERDIKREGMKEAGIKSDNKLEWERRKQIDRDIRRISNQILMAEETIEKLENDLKEKDEILSNPENHRNAIDYNQFSKEYDSLRNELDSEIKNWEELQIKLEDLKDVAK
ncbi:MAG: ATP-binding cassette domain-containing protein [Bacteroidales bacterium]|nr:ATP-binding cassette domain-containing protein [Bacteroidales bacterium]